MFSQRIRKVRRAIVFLVLWGMILPGSLMHTPTLSAQTPTLTVYDDRLTGGWENWSWDTSVDFSATGEVYQGTSALAVSFDAGWGGLYLHSEAELEDGYDTLRFWIYGNGATINVYVDDEANNAVELGTITPPVDTWTQVDMDLSLFGSSTNLRGLNWMDWTGGPQPVFFLDEIQLIDRGRPDAVPVESEGPALYIDAAADHHPISPFIYGMNYADPALAAATGLTVNRWGGNATTRYNWQNDIANRASDWYFINHPNNNPDTSRLPADSSADRFVAANVAVGVQTIMTIPMIGWTSHDQPGACGFSVAKYGEQQDADPWNPDCGNGVRPDGTLIIGNDPADTSLAIGPEFVQNWLRHLNAQFGSATAGGVRFYNLDNEPFLWDSTHRDVFPDALSYDDLRDRTYHYAAAIKAVDPDAETLGPVVWGWVAYFYSALDVASNETWWINSVDRNAHGGEPFVAWYLAQMQLYEQLNSQRILDYLDLHYYPQASGVALSGAGSTDTQALRLRSTRSLWDPDYVDESWIDEAVYLIPRMHTWVNENYPGTKLAITEYNFGALDHINGALAQADVLGIFGREGLDLATLWDPPAPDDPGAFAFRMYRNYDGANHTFGDTSIQATSADEGQLAVYAALRDDGALTIMVINKTSVSLNSPVTVQNFDGGVAQVYCYSAAHLDRIEREADMNFGEESATVSFPPNSIMLFVLSAGS